MKRHFEPFVGDVRKACKKLTWEDFPQKCVFGVLKRALGGGGGGGGGKGRKDTGMQYCCI
jgi:hypothetical protein